MAKNRGPRHRPMPTQIDVGYYTVYQPVQGGGEIQVGELVVEGGGSSFVETWFLYTSGQGIYKWPSSSNVNQATRYIYQNSTTTVTQVKQRLDQYGPTYRYVEATCEG